MAEIKIEKKTTYWPWVLLGILLLAAIVYFTLFRTNEPESTVATVVETDSTDNSTPPAAVSHYMAYINSDTNSMGLDHEYASQAITQLTEAVNATAEKNSVEIDDNISQAKDLANKITVDPMEITHANSIRKAADLLSNALSRIQASKFPQLKQDADEVNQAAASIDPDKLTLDQKDAVKAFFKKAAGLLERMNQS